MGNLVRQVTPDEVRAYDVAGVVLLKGILDLATVNTLRRTIDEAMETAAESASFYDLSAITRATQSNDVEELVAQSGGQHDIASIVEYVKASAKPLLLDEQTGKGSFLLDTGVASRHSEFKRLCIRGAIPEIAGSILGSAKVHFYGDQVFVKEPGTRERTAFHQDAPYFNINGEQCCVMWIPVDPVTAKTGGMMYVRGSHREGCYAPNVFISQTRMPGSEGPDLPNIEGALDGFDIVQFDVEPGDVLVHHYKTIHGTGGNLSRYQVRRAASLRYCGDDIRIKNRPGTPRQLHHTQELRDGDPLSGPDFPVVWRKKQSQTAA